MNVTYGGLINATGIDITVVGGYMGLKTRLITLFSWSVLNKPFSQCKRGLFFFLQVNKKFVSRVDNVIASEQTRGENKHPECTRIAIREPPMCGARKRGELKQYGNTR